MRNALLGQVLGSVFANSMRGRANPGPFGRMGGGGLGGAALGSVLGGMMLNRGRMGVRGSSHGGLMLALLLPMAMQWVQRNGGIGAVLEKFRQKGYGQHAQSWVASGDNDVIDVDAVDKVVGEDELSRIAQKLGVPKEDVADAFAEILPEMTNQLSPEGEIPPQADDALDHGRQQLEQELQKIRPEVQLS
jgi:uncharacterized protein YidB (DUF937 family)